MKNEILPQGDYIRQLLVKSNITTSNINTLLRDKGVFLGHNEKNNSVPLLMKSIVSPNDYKELYETQKTKEETIKYKTSSIKCNSDFSFADLLNIDIDINYLISEKHTYKPGYKVNGSPNFYPDEEENDVWILDYDLERENLLSDWTSNTSSHKGSITLKKISEDEVQISVRQNSTSKETFEVNNILMDVLQKRMHEKSIINSKKDIISVKFKDFTNNSRVKFFNSFAGDFSIYLEYKSITDIDLYLDENVDSHDDVKLFLNEIDNLKLRGKDLQKHILLINDNYYPKLIFGASKIRFRLTYAGIRGSVLISLGFQDYVKNKNENSHFQISIDISLNKDDKNQKTENAIRKKLLEVFEKKKVDSYEQFKVV